MIGQLIFEGPVTVTVMLLQLAVLGSIAAGQAIGGAAQPPPAFIPHTVTVNPAGGVQIAGGVPTTQGSVMPE